MLDERRRKVCKEVRCFRRQACWVDEFQSAKCPQAAVAVIKFILSCCWMWSALCTLGGEDEVIDSEGRVRLLVRKRYIHRT